jgi:hypothetical protein
MQSLEATISLLVFLSLSSSFIISSMTHRIDDSVYRSQLAEDAWRVLYLRGDFSDFSDSSRGIIESDMRRLGEETSLCFFIKGVEFTNCREDGTNHTMIASVGKTVIADGSPKRIAFSIGK